MSKKVLYILWGCLYALCAGLGFIQEPTGAIYGTLFCTGLLFFIPPTAILYQAIEGDDQQTLRLLRGISVGSLAATMVVILLNIMSYRAPAVTGDVMHVLLVIVSVPMMCGQVWVVSMFCWALLMLTAWSKIKKTKEKRKG